MNDKRALSKPVLVIDIPGHEKLRFLFLSWEQQLGGIVFVVDAAAFSRNFRQVAEYLYDVLSNEHVVQGRVPVLVACNKSDLPDAQPAHRVQSTLEAELYVDLGFFFFFFLLIALDNRILRQQPAAHNTIGCSRPSIG